MLGSVVEMAGVQIRVPLHGSAYSGFVVRYMSSTSDDLHTIRDCHRAYFIERYGEWLERQSRDPNAVLDSVRVEGHAGTQRQMVVTFGSDDADCAILFKLTFGGTA